MTKGNINSTLGKSWNLLPIWEAGIAIYQVFSKICEKHGLRHFGGFGTALGAVRHKGFIPWDDDIDLLMPRPDYEKFFLLASNELPDHLCAIKEPIIDGYKLSFGKICEKDEEKIKNIEKSSCLHLKYGISMDIFPLDGCPSNPLKFYLWQGKISLINAMLWARAEKKPSRNLSWRLKMRFYLGRCLNCFFFSRKRPDEIVKIKRNLEKCYDYDSSEMAGVVGSIYGTNALRIPKIFYGHAKKSEFEKILLDIPENAEGYLQCVYGNYMTLPPQEEQIPKHLMKVS